MQVGRVEPEEGGFWQLGEWDQTDMANPWIYSENFKMAPFDEQVVYIINGVILQAFRSNNTCFSFSWS